MPFHSNLYKQVPVEVPLFSQPYLVPIAHSSRNAELLFRVYCLLPTPLATRAELFDLLALSTTGIARGFHHKHALPDSLGATSIARNAFLRSSARFAPAPLARFTSDRPLVLDSLV